MRKWAFSLAFLVWISLVTAASLLDVEDMGPDLFEIPFGDKLGHFVFYAGAMFLGLMAMRDWFGKLLSFTYAARIAFLALFAYGLLMEGMQWAMANGRSAEWQDVLANSLGLVAGLYSAKWMFHSLKGLNWPD